MALFSARNISKVYGTGPTALTVLEHLSLDIEAGQMTAIIGASGSGKTTLLQILGTLDAPTSGEIYFEDELLSKKSASELARFRNGSIGFVFQFHHLLPDFTALENVMMPGLICRRSHKQMTAPARELLTRVGLEHRLHHKVGELSGGEQQRAALARALVMNPAILLADEPTGNLDARAGEVVFELLFELGKERNLSTIMVTHNTALAEKMDRCLTLAGGKLSSESRAQAPV